MCIVCVVVVSLDVVLMDEFCVFLDFIFIIKVEELINEFKENYIIIIVIYNM